MSAYVNMVYDLLRNSLPKAIVYCQVYEAFNGLYLTISIPKLGSER